MAYYDKKWSNFKLMNPMKVKKHQNIHLEH